MAVRKVAVGCGFVTIDPREPAGGFIVLGAPGSGKSRLAARIAAASRLDVFELDRLYWLPGWERRPKGEFADLVAVVARAGPTIVVGNYLAWVPPLLWPTAAHIIWLDLPRHLTFRRLVSRTLRQTLRGEEILPGCTQSLHAAVRDGLFRTGWDEPRQLRDKVPTLLRELEIDPLRLERLRTTREVAQWIPGASRAG